MNGNQYINYLELYINYNTPVTFILNEDKYQEISKKLKPLDISKRKKEIVNAMYALFYTSINYHRKASESLKNRPYNVLIGDYISSYIVEILYKNELDELLNLFSHNTKETILNILNDSKEDYLLTNILELLKKIGD